jgi:hypothetical protein
VVSVAGAKGVATVAKGLKKQIKSEALEKTVVVSEVL